MRRRDEGFILVAMIWIIAILAVLTLGFAHRSLIDQRAAALALDHSRAQYLARGSVHYAVADMRNAAFMEGIIERARAQLAGNVGFRARNAPPQQAMSSLKLTNEAPNLITSGDFFSSVGEGNTVSYAVVDAEGRISVNTAPEEVLDNVEKLDMRAVSAIMRRRGSELAPEERTPFLAIEELRRVEDIDDDAWIGDNDTRGLRDLFTVYGDGRINVNTASREVLEAVPDLDESTIDRIVGFRQGMDGKLGTEDDRQFRSLDTMSRDLEIDPTDLAPLLRYCTFESHFLTITGFAALRQGKVRAATQAVVNLQPGNAVVLSWSEGEFGPQIAH